MHPEIIRNLQRANRNIRSAIVFVWIAIVLLGFVTIVEAFRLLRHLWP